MEVVEDGNKKKWIKCLLCNEVLKGVGVHRLKLHLAGVVSAVKGWKNVTAEVRYEMEQSIEKFAGRKRRADEATTRVRGATDGDDCMEVSPQLVVSSTRAIQAKKGKGVALSNAATNHRADRFFLSRGQPGDQQTIKSMLQSQEAVERVDLIINKWFLDASIAFNATTSKYHQPMIDAIASIGDGYQVPSMYRMRGPLLRKNVENTRNFVESYRKSWKESGCGIMADGWTDRKRRTLVNFLVYCPKGTIFLKSVDASTANSKIGDFLFKLFSNVVRFVGVENVVYFVTDNASNMVLTGKKLDAEFPSIYWSPCAAHCLNLIMTDLGKLELVQSTVAHASKITRYLYNHCTPLFLMRKFTNGHEILRPAPTRFATNFVALQSIHKQKDALRTMVISKEWTTASFAKELKARKIVDLILDQQFWNDCASICNFSEPLGRVLRIVDNDERPAMGYLFGALHCAIEEIEKRFQRKKKAIQQNIVNAIEARWDKHINKNLHVAGFWFNPINQYDEELMSKYHTTTFGVLDCIERYATKDPALSKALTTRMRIFRNAEGDFGRVTTINDRYTMLPDEWWLTYGCSAPNLQKLAIRVLSQTCSASVCERNWSLFEHIHSNKRNRLEHQVMNDIAYVQCNSRIEQKSKIRTRNFDPICMEDISKFDAQWILEDDPQVLNAKKLDRFWKGLMPNDQEICNAMNDEDQWIDNGYDTDASQDNDETSNPTPPAN